MQGFVTAIYEIGCLFGAIFILSFGDFLGRRRAMMMGGSIMILGVIIQVTAERNSTPLAQFIIGRTITGVGNGINTSTIPTYQAECSRTSNRGLLICIEGGVIAFGTLVAYWIDYGASYGSADLSWRFPIAFQTVFALILVLGMIWLPESPRWLLTRERYDEGETVIAALRGLERDDKETQLQKRIIMDSIRASGYAGRKGTPFKAVFTGGKTQHFRRMMLGVSSQFMQQVGGCNAVIYYFPILFETSIHQSHNISLLLGGVNMIVYAIFATVSWFIIERVGRRKLFLWGTVGQCLSMVLVFSCLIPGTPAAAKGAAVGLFTYIASFGASWLPLPWVSIASLAFTNEQRERLECNLTVQNSSTQPKSTPSKPARKPTPSPPAQTGSSTSVSPPNPFKPFSLYLSCANPLQYTTQPKTLLMQRPPSPRWLSPNSSPNPASAGGRVGNPDRSSGSFFPFPKTCRSN